MDVEKDPIGFAINDFSENGFSENIVVKADLCEDDIMPVEYLFRGIEEMPELELKALELCEGKVLDVGAAAGCHSRVLQERGFDVTAIDTSPGAISYLRKNGIQAEKADFFEFEGQFDTILVLMNGIGITGKLKRLPLFLQQIKKNLTPGGKALCDSTNLTYLYEEDDGSVWVDLNSQYLGEMQFQMTYKGMASDWFNWLYVEFEILKEEAEKAGLNCEMIMEGPSDNFLVSLTHKL